MTEYSGLRFERRPSAPRRAVFIGLATLAFNLVWWRVDPDDLYWVLLAGFTTLAWMSSYGWRPALSALRHLIQRLEQF